VLRVSRGREGVDEIDLPAAPDCSAALTWAVGRVAERLDQVAGAWMSSREEILAALERIARELRGATDLPAPGPGQIRVSNPVLYFRLLDALREEVLNGWRSGSEPEASEGSVKTARPPTRSTASAISGSAAATSTGPNEARIACTRVTSDQPLQR